MKNFIKNLSDGGLAEDIHAFMERTLDEQPKSEMVNKQEFIEKAKAWLKAKNEMCMFELEMILGSNFIEDFVKAMEE